MANSYDQPADDRAGDPSAVANFLYIPYFPVWSVVVIAIDIFVIWALLSPLRRYA
jgi:hypothetical protein